MEVSGCELGIKNSQIFTLFRYTYHVNTISKKTFGLAYRMYFDVVEFLLVQGRWWSRLELARGHIEAGTAEGRHFAAGLLGTRA